MKETNGNRERVRERQLQKDGKTCDTKERHMNENNKGKIEQMDKARTE